MYFNRHTSIRTLLIAGLLLVAATGCSTKKNTALGRFWHNTNTKFNGYFNGNEAIKLGMQELSKSRKDDFSKIIPVFDYGDKANWASMNANSDRAIKKAVIMIKKHSMFINGKQHNRWIDDCYFLMGKANFFKQEHSLGVNQIKHVVDNSEKKYTKDEARIWMMRTYNEMGEYAESATVMRGVETGSMDKKLLPEFYAVSADLYIRQKEWEKALENLDEAIKWQKSKKKNARLEFIRGQIYEIIGQDKKAYDSYANVVKAKPEYVLEFQSRINMAKTAENSNSTELRKTLKKMLRDGKNIEYLDQIYYALALVDIKEDNTDDAIDNLNKSLRNSTGNVNQQGLSYLKLAEIHMARKKYVPAQGYYDSTSVSLNKDHPKYEEVMRLKENLTVVVNNIMIVETQDSLQLLAQMDKTELEDYFTRYVEKLKEQDEEAKNNPNTNPVNFNPSSNPNAKWYFTNQQQLTLGSADFKKNWGNRPLEDNWRRLDKSGSFLSNTVEDTAQGDDENNPRYNIDTYISQVPKTDSAINVSNQMIYKALYDLGTVYKDKILDFNKSAEAYEELVKRNSTKDAEYFPITYFQLYNIYKAQGKENKMNEYRDIILSQYPTSDYAALISDPDGFKEKNEKKDEASPVYTTVYNQYISGDYTGSLSGTIAALGTYKNSLLRHRFALLKALNTDKIAGRDSFKVELQSVVANYKGTESAVMAQRLLDAIEGKNTSANGTGPESQEKTPVFKYDAQAEHFVIIYIPDATKKVDGAVGKINEFNDTEFPLKGYSTSNSLLPQSGQVILIRKFANATEAGLYVNMYNDKGIMLKLNLNAPSKIMAISTSNYAMLIKTPSMAEYQNFHTANYMK